MNKSGGLGMALHQAASFHPALLRLPHAEAVFWPGCALMNLDPAILQRTLAILRREERDIALAAACCAQPTVYLFPEKASARQEQLRRELARCGVRRVYTACPNCAVQLRALGGVEVQPIWTVLAKHLRAEDVSGSEERVVWHDPCPTRKESEQLAAVRELLGRCGCDYCEPEHSGRATICCGNIHMLRTTDPEKSAKLRQLRLSELPEQRVVASCCEGCLDAFRSEGRQTVHLLELLFGKSPSRGWGNRLRTTRGIKRND